MSTVSSLLLTGSPAPGRRAPIGMFRLAWLEVRTLWWMTLNVCALFLSSKPLVFNNDHCFLVCSLCLNTDLCVYENQLTEREKVSCLLTPCSAASCLMFLYISSHCTAVQSRSSVVTDTSRLHILKGLVLKSESPLAARLLMFVLL